MNFFDLFPFSFGRANALSARTVKKRKKRRTLKIEELENREMLDAGLMSALEDVFTLVSTITENETMMAQSEDCNLVDFSGNLPHGNTVASSQIAPAPPAGSNYNVGDWTKLETLGLTEEQILDLAIAVWAEIESEQRLTELHVAGLELTGTLDLADCIVLTTLDCSNNQLTELNLTGCAALTTLNCSSNQLSYSDLPQPSAVLTTYDYSQQITMPMTIETGTSKVVNLSSEYLEGTTTFTWYDAELGTEIAPADFITDIGRFTFTGLAEGDEIYCIMTSTRFPDLTLQTTDVAILGGLPSPTLGNMTALNSREIQANWNEVEFATGYKVEYSIDEGETWQTWEGMPVINEGVASVTIGELRPLTLYQIRVSAIGSVEIDDSVPSEVGQVTTDDYEYNTNDRGKLEALGLSAAQIENLDIAVWKIVGMERRLIELRVDRLGLAGTMDVADCTELAYLSCSYNQLTVINVTGCVALKTLDSSSNQLASLDTSMCTALISLKCSSNQLTSLNVSDCLALETLLCSSNQLTSLDVMRNSALTTLSCYANKLTFATLPPPAVATYRYNPQSEIPLTIEETPAGVIVADLSSEYLSGRTRYTWYYNNGTLVDSAAYSNNRGLFTFTGLNIGAEIYCALTHQMFPDLSIKTAMGTIPAPRLPSPMLVNVEVNDSAQIDVEWTAVEDASGYRVEFSPAGGEWVSWAGDFVVSGAITTTTITGLDANTSYRIRVAALGSEYFSDSNPSDERLITTEKVNLPSPIIRIPSVTDTSVNLEWNIVSDASGYRTEYSTDGINWTEWAGAPAVGEAYVTLSVDTLTPNTEYRFRVTALGEENFNNSLPSAVKLATTGIAYNADEWAKLEGLGLTEEQILHESVVIWEDVELEYRVVELRLVNMGLTGILDLTGFTALRYLSCASNQLDGLTLTDSTALETLLCSSNQISTLDLSANTALKSISCVSNQLKMLDVSKNTALEYLACYSNQLIQLNVTGNTVLKTLYCSSNLLMTLNVSNNTILQSLTCSYNQLTTLDVSNNKALLSLTCSANTLAELDVSNNLALQTLNVSSNRLMELDVSSNAVLQSLNASENQLMTLDVSSNTALQTLNVSMNQLLTLNVPEESALQTADVTNNRLTFSALPTLSIVAFDYTPQANIPISIASKVGSVIDLSSEYFDGTTVYTWYYNNGTVVDPSSYRNDDGRFTFFGLEFSSAVYCKMTQSQFPALTLTTQKITLTDMIKIAPEPNGILISWTGTMPEESVIQYRPSTSTEWYTLFGTVTEKSIKIVGMPAGTYDFRVSNQGDAALIGAGITITAATVAAPSPLKPKVTVDTKINKPTISSVTLIITPSPKATAESNALYVIDLVQEGKTPNPDFAPIIVSADYLAQNQNRIEIDGRKPGTSHKFSVTAWNANGSASNGKKDVMVTKTAKSVKFSAVQKLKLDKTALPPKGVSANSAALTWNASKAVLPVDATVRYEILWFEGKSKTPTVLPETTTYIIAESTTGITATINGLTANTKYKFAVREIITVEIAEVGKVDITALDATVSVKTLK